MHITLIDNNEILNCQRFDSVDATRNELQLLLLLLLLLLLNCTESTMKKIKNREKMHKTHSHRQINSVNKSWNRRQLYS